MSNPQITMEEIVLLPHPLDAWRGALEALIACAPGSEFDIAWHLADAAGKLQRAPEELSVGHTEARLINQLVLLSAGRQAGAQLEPVRNLYGFMRAASAIGEPDEHHRAGPPTSPESDGLRHQSLSLSSSHPAALDPVAGDPQARTFQGSQPDTTRPAPVRSPEHSAPQFDRS
ncbi:hypothetical protein D9M69_534560 [compost metagenome]